MVRGSLNNAENKENLDNIPPMAEFGPKPADGGSLNDWFKLIGGKNSA